MINPFFPSISRQDHDLRNKDEPVSVLFRHFKHCNAMQDKDAVTEYGGRRVLLETTKNAIVNISARECNIKLMMQLPILSVYYFEAAHADLRSDQPYCRQWTCAAKIYGERIELVSHGNDIQSLIEEHAKRCNEIRAASVSVLASRRLAYDIMDRIYGPVE